MSPPSLTPTDLRMIADLLESASSEFSNHGCNDRKWPSWFPKADRYAFALAVATDMGDPKEAPEEAESQAQSNYGPMDWMLMSYYARLLGRLASTPTWRRVAEEPPPKDVLVLLSWGSEEGSAVGRRSDDEGTDLYFIEEVPQFCDPPDWWMPLPVPPQR